MLAVGRLVGSLYVLDESGFSPFWQTSCKLEALNVHSFANPCVHNSSLNNEMNLLALWHHQFGHVSVSILQHFPFLSHLNFYDLSTCPICPLAKQSRLPFLFLIAKLAQQLRLS